MECRTLTITTTIAPTLTLTLTITLRYTLAIPLTIYITLAVTLSSISVLFFPSPSFHIFDLFLLSSSFLLLPFF